MHSKSKTTILRYYLVIKIIMIEKSLFCNFLVSRRTPRICKYHNANMAIILSIIIRKHQMSVLLKDYCWRNAKESKDISIPIVAKSVELDPSEANVSHSEPNSSKDPQD
jgi:hypothetical protein